MIITFLGHASFCEADKYKGLLTELLENTVKDNTVEFYLGGYGGFDSFAYSCCLEYKKSHPLTASLIFVTPYLNGAKLNECANNYDARIYPPIEHIPKKLAIIYRNRYMVDCSDVVVCYIKREYGGAFQGYKYAIKNKKKIYNIENFSKST